MVLARIIAGIWGLFIGLVVGSLIDLVGSDPLADSVMVVTFTLVLALIVLIAYLYYAYNELLLIGCVGLVLGGVLALIVNEFNLFIQPVEVTLLLVVVLYGVLRVGKGGA